MSVFLVTYDLNREAMRSAVVTEIESFEACVRLSESSYAVATPLVAKDIYDRLKQHLQEDDFLYVLTVTRPYMAFGAQRANDWLEANVPHS